MSNNKSDLAKSILGPQAEESVAKAASPEAAAPKVEQPKENPHLPKPVQGDAVVAKVLTKKNHSVAFKSQLEKAEKLFAKGEVLVEAKEKGVYPNGRRRKVGEKFKVKSIDLFSPRWMKIVE